MRNVGLTVVKDLQAKGGMDVSDDEAGARDNDLLPAGGGKAAVVTSDDVVAAMLEASSFVDCLNVIFGRSIWVVSCLESDAAFTPSYTAVPLILTTILAGPVSAVAFCST